jgi:hypothetical protein
MDKGTRQLTRLRLQLLFLGAIFILLFLFGR